MRRLSLLLVMCLVPALGVAACGDDNKDGTTATQPATTETQTTDTGAAGGGETVQVSADPSGALKFEQNSLTAKPGKDTFEFTNDSSTPHDFAVEQDGKELGKTEVISSSSDKLALDLEAGDYTFFCSVPGHRQAGMEGTLNVK